LKPLASKFGVGGPLETGISLNKPNKFCLCVVGAFASTPHFVHRSCRQTSRSNPDWHPMRYQLKH